LVLNIIIPLPLSVWLVVGVPIAAVSVLFKKIHRKDKDTTLV